MDSNVAPPAPSCPFCGAAWSDDMLAALDRATHACSCCGGSPHPVAAMDTGSLAAEDIACAGCGRVLFTTPSAA